MNALPLPTLTKRGVAVLSIIGTASVFLSLGALFKPDIRPVSPPPPQIIVIVVPAMPVSLPPVLRAPAQGIIL